MRGPGTPIAIVGLILSALLMAAGIVCAQGVAPYPVKPIRVVIPFSPGGTPDLQMRILEEKITSRLGQPFVHDYRPGAAGSIGMEVGARAPADGYTLIIGTVGSWAVNPHLYKPSYTRPSASRDGQQ